MRSFSLGWLFSGERDVEHLLIRCDLWGLGCTIFVCSWSTCCRHAERLLSQAVDTGSPPAKNAMYFTPES